MNTNHSDQSPLAEGEDDTFFNAMNEHSANMRQSASAMAETLKSMNIKSNEIVSVTKSLTHIVTVNIEKMDQAINELTQTFSILNARITKNNKLAESISETQLEELLKNYDTLINEASLLAKKAFELRG